MFLLKACPKCCGDLQRVWDSETWVNAEGALVRWYLSCVQCGEEVMPGYRPWSIEAGPVRKAVRH